MMTEEELQPCLELDNSTVKQAQAKTRQPKDRDDQHENFDMLPRFLLLDLIRAKGNARNKLIVYLCKHRDSNNKIDKTQEEIAKESGISLRTVKNELTDLAGRNLIKKKYGVIMINPNFIVRGSKQKREYLEKTYVAFGKKRIKTESINNT